MPISLLEYTDSLGCTSIMYCCGNNYIKFERKGSCKVVIEGSEMFLSLDHTIVFVSNAYKTRTIDEVRIFKRYGKELVYVFSNVSIVAVY